MRYTLFCFVVLLVIMYFISCASSRTRVPINETECYHVGDKCVKRTRIMT